jgi:hypothetical protein
MESGGNTLLIAAGLGLGALILTQSASAQPGCVDTIWTCNTTDRLEHSNCGNTRTTTPCSLASDAYEMIHGIRDIDLRYDVNNNGTVDTDDVTLLKNGTPLRVLPPALLLSGNYLDGGNIYSPEIDIANNRMYFGGWYNSSGDYPYDSVYVADLNNITNVRKIIQIHGQHVNDPSMVNNKLYMTCSPDPLDGTKQYIAIITTNDNGTTWSAISQVVPTAWLPSAILTDNLYLYYTSAVISSTQLLRVKLNDTGNAVTGTPIPVTFDDPGFYPVNVCIKYYDGTYYLLGDYFALVNGVATYCIGMWTSAGGIDFTKYLNNPIVIPSGTNIVARTPYFIKEGNRLRIWYAQQKPNWWTNAIYYVEYNIY